MLTKSDAVTAITAIIFHTVTASPMQIPYINGTTMPPSNIDRLNRDKSAHDNALVENADKAIFIKA